MTDDFIPVVLPPIYSAEDAERRAQLLRQLAHLRRRYTEEAEPLAKELVEIDNRYPRRMVAMPKGTGQ